MELQKRECGIKVSLEPSGCQFLHVSFDFGGERLEFLPSSVMSGQFADLIRALYSLYPERYSGQSSLDDDWRKRKYLSDEKHVIHGTAVTVDWDNEGEELTLELTREINGSVIGIRATMDGEETVGEYTVDDRDFCYAVTKAYTEVLKKFGFFGYVYSTEGDTVMLHQFLFLKAYALGNMEARELTEAEDGSERRRTNFEKELELLLFDM